MAIYGNDAEPPPTGSGSRDRRRRGVIAGIIVAAVTAFVVAIASGAGTAVWTWISGGSSRSSSPTPASSLATTASDLVTAAERVQACQRAHGLAGQDSLTKTANGYIATSCTWPPSTYAEADGFTEIKVESVYVRNTAPDNYSIDRIVGPCKKFQAAYDFVIQGGTVIHGPVFTASPGIVVDSDGAIYVEHPERFDNQLLRQMVGFSPARDELEVIYVEGGSLVSLRCAE
jgi:hypothetical protein